LVATNTLDQWLKTPYSKILAGYPLNANAGQLHERISRTSLFDAWQAIPRVFSSTEFNGLPGNSGGPLCLDLSGTNSPPVAVYLGQTGNQGLFRVIDSEAAGLIQQAEYSSYTGQNHVGGGQPFAVHLCSGGSPWSPGSCGTGVPNLTVILESDAQAAGLGWRVRESADESYIYGASNSIVVPFPGNYTMEFKATNSSLSLTSLPFTIVDGQVLEGTFNFGPIRLSLSRIASEGRIRVLAESPPFFQIVLEAKPDLNAKEWTPVEVRMIQNGLWESIIDPSRSMVFLRARAL
jgi:hypothetical protein